jgi:hypothetical protein
VLEASIALCDQSRVLHPADNALDKIATKVIPEIREDLLQGPIHSIIGHLRNEYKKALTQKIGQRRGGY